MTRASRIRVDRAGRGPLDPVVADRGGSRAGVVDVPLGPRLQVGHAVPVLRRRRAACPPAGEAVGHQLDPDRVRGGPGAGPVRLVERTGQVLDMVPELVREHVLLGERATGRTKAGAGLVVEAGVEVDLLVVGAVEGAGGAARLAAGRRYRAAEQVHAGLDLGDADRRQRTFTFASAPVLHSWEISVVACCCPVVIEPGLRELPRLLGPPPRCERTIMMMIVRMVPPITIPLPPATQAAEPATATADLDLAGVELASPVEAHLNLHSCRANASCSSAVMRSGDALPGTRVRAPNPATPRSHARRGPARWPERAPRYGSPRG